MKKRILILLLLAQATCLYRLPDLYQQFFSDQLPWTQGFSLRVEADDLVVDQVAEGEPGQPGIAYEAGLRAEDRIVAAYDAQGEVRQIRGLFDYGEAIRSIPRDEPRTLVVERTDPEGRRLTLQLVIPPPQDEAATVQERAIPLALSLIFPFIAIATAFAIGFLNLESPHAFRASLLFLAFSTVFAVNPFTFPPLLRELALFYYVTLNSFLAYLFLSFFFQFPTPSPLERRTPWLRPLCLALTLLFWFLSLIVSFSIGFALDRWVELRLLTGRFQAIFYALWVGMLVLGLTSLVLNTIRAEGPDQRRRMVLLLSGTSAGFIPLILFILYMAWFEPDLVSPWLLGIVGVSLILFPLSFVYVVVRHRVVGIRLILRRGLQYALVSKGFLVAEGVLIFIIVFFATGPFFDRHMPELGAGLTGFFTAAVTLASVLMLRRLNRRVMPAIDRRFFREAYNAQQLLTDLSRKVRRLAGNRQLLVETIARKSADSLHPEHVAVFLRGNLNAPSRRRLIADGRSVGEGQSGRDFRCVLLQRRRHGGPLPEAVNGERDSLTLAPESFIVRYLKEMINGEPEALEVYLGDPMSWTRGLMRKPSDEALREKMLLEKLGTRLIVPLLTQDDLLGFISLGEKLSEEPYSKEDRELLLAVAEQTAIALDYAVLIDQTAEQESLRREVEIAKEVQDQLFPQNLPAIPALDYYGLCKPARGVGGDYYDFLQLRPDLLFVALGDISGKGISAALLMASLQALIRSRVPMRGESVQDLVNDINRLMCSSTDGSKFATFFCGNLDLGSKVLTFVNAGHNPPILLNDTGRREKDESSDQGSEGLAKPRAGGVRLLEATGTVLGLFEESRYEQESVKLQEGDILVVYTDGISEATNASGDEYGEARIIRLVLANRELTAQELAEVVIDDVHRFVEDQPLHDDLTLAILKLVEPMDSASRDTEVDPRPFETG